MRVGSGKRVKVAEVGDLPVGQGRVIEAEGSPDCTDPGSLSAPIVVVDLGLGG